jgi:hypothetical protein
VQVEVAGLPGATELKTADLTAMRRFEFRDEFSGLHRTANRVTLAQPSTCSDKPRVYGTRLPSRYVTYQLAEVAVTRNLFAAILARIARLAIPPPVVGLIRV